MAGSVSSPISGKLVSLVFRYYTTLKQYFPDSPYFPIHPFFQHTFQSFHITHPTYVFTHQRTSTCRFTAIPLLCFNKLNDTAYVITKYTPTWFTNIHGSPNLQMHPHSLPLIACLWWSLNLLLHPCFFSINTDAVVTMVIYHIDINV